MASGIGSVASLIPFVHHNVSDRACQNFRTSGKVASPVRSLRLLRPREGRQPAGLYAVFVVDKPRQGVRVDLIPRAHRGGLDHFPAPRFLELVRHGQEKTKEPTGPGTFMILTLVFFVLAAAILGVTTYLGFNGQKEWEDRPRRPTRRRPSSKAAWPRRRLAATSCESRMELMIRKIARISAAGQVASRQHP